jgi:hypothetical protein
MGGIF